MRDFREDRETFSIKAYYVVAFLISTILSFFMTDSLAAWVKLKSEIFALLPIQLVLAALLGYLFSIIEGRIIWRLTQQDGFHTIYPVSMGLSLGYLLHYCW